MPPYTRRSSGWSHNANDTPGRNGSGTAGPNIEYFLEHLEQFKRKHISQNRDIIKSNAFLQLRIRDLESRIQRMDVEKHHDHRLIARLRAESYESSQQQGCVDGREIWLELGKRLGFMGSEAMGRGTSSTTGSARRAVPSMPSVRVSLDPENLPGGVARAIARAPADVGILEEMEDEQVGDAQQERNHTEQHGLYHAWTSSSAGHSHALSQLLESPAASLPQGIPRSPASPVSASMTLPQTASNGSNSSSATQWNSFLPPQRSTGEAPSQSSTKPKKSESMKGKTSVGSSSTARQSGAPTARTSKKVSVASSGTVGQAPSASRRDDIPRISADETTPSVEEGHGQPVDGGSTSTQQTQGGLASGSKSIAGPSEQDQPPPSAATARKRKPSSAREPDIPGLDAYSDHLDDISDTPATDEDEPEELVGASRSSRRSSVRARPSINYALPKLNTKMRKPDPPTEDLRAATTLSAAALAGPTTLIGTGEGEANGDLKDLKRERQLRQGESSTHSAARKSSAKSRASKGGARRSQLNGEAVLPLLAYSESEGEERDGDDERGKGSGMTSGVESSADERDSRDEYRSIVSASSDQRRAESHILSRCRDSGIDDADEDEGEETIIASAPVALPPAVVSTDSDEEEIEVARGSAARQEEADENSDFKTGKAMVMPFTTIAISEKGPFTPISAAGLNLPAHSTTAQARSGMTAKGTILKSLNLASSVSGSLSTERHAIDSANAAVPVQVASTSSNGGSDGGHGSKPTSGNGASRQSLSSLQYKKRVSSDPSSGGLTDADLALLAQSTSSLADLTSASAWPSTPQVGVGSSLLKTGAGGLKGRGAAPLGSTTHKVSALSRFANSNGNTIGGAGGFVKNTSGTMGGSGGQRSLGKIKPFNLSASTSQNVGTGTATSALTPASGIGMANVSGAGGSRSGGSSGSGSVKADRGFGSENRGA